MVRKILITGIDGMLSSDLSKCAETFGLDVAGYTHSQLDITNHIQVREIIQSIKPDIVVNTPGISVDECENNPEYGYRIHTWASGLMASACENINATLVYISSCGLFGDDIKLYSEYDPVELKTKYANSKFLGEQEARTNCSRTFVIRPGWLYGGTPSHKRNFVYQRYLESLNKNILKSATDKFGSPTSTSDLSNCILAIIDTEAYGLYHVTNSGIGSRYDYVKSVLEAFDSKIPVEAVDSSAFPRPSPVPNCEALENTNLKYLGIAQPSDWQEALHRYVHNLKKLL